MTCNPAVPICPAIGGTICRGPRLRRGHLDDEIKGRHREFPLQTQTELPSLTCHHYGGSYGKEEADLRSCCHQGRDRDGGHTFHHHLGATRRGGPGFDRAGIAKVVRSTNQGMFYKSMTTHADHRVWQDVYHVSLEDGLMLYVKFQANVVTEFTVVSFKEK
ncbi:type II toxin-antitoxin system MqsR family toxin [Bradyrhizobium sp. UNPA324]|uniref:type II toxin-antitoxin system MqsR family toxin n=1 Tax=Bradyrhizobium sp. UNPA324 TaxID=1141174 RepID=UPI001FEFB3A5|nr:type II toxin-antitoxin system MqsR family toxin [Bradyrhizobium sp. UNPA324]